MRFWLILFALFLCTAYSEVVVAFGDEPDRFFREIIAPILQENCLRCHAGDQVEGDLDLSSHAGLFESRASTPVVVPQRADASRLIEVLLGDKPEMPKNSKPLSPAQIDALRKWIDAGAQWPDGLVLKTNPLDWWSLRPLELPVVPSPTLNGKSWGNNEIDAFVLTKLQAMELAPSPPADRRTLIRRVYYDLIGLPPTLDEVQKFELDSSPHAYANLVNKLLDSPQYGERWAQHWLDVAHYGDTHGYDKDKVRPNAWPYRDYVIRAFNTDKPYSQFVREQLAGDVFAPDSVDGITALGFLAAGPFDFVGQIEVRDGTLEKKRVRNIDRDDMVSVTMNTFVSQTAQCARCHNHKFDPISQEDYYSLQAVFACIDRADRPYDSDPKIAEQRKHLAQQRLELLQRKASIAERIQLLGGDELASVDKAILESANQVENSKRPEFGYHSDIAPMQDTNKWVQVDLGESKSLGSVTMFPAHDDFAGIGAGFGFPVRYRIEASDDPAFATSHLLVDQTMRDVANPGIVPVTISASETTARFVRITATKLATRQNDYIFALAELSVTSPTGKDLTKGSSVIALDSIEAPARWSKANLIDGVSPVASSKELAIRAAELQSKRQSILERVVSESIRSEQQHVDQALEATEIQIKALPAQQQVFAAATEFAAQGSFVSTQGKPRVIHLLDRGSENSPQREVGPGTVGCIPGLESRFANAETLPDQGRREALAKWITDPRNSLTWRSIVNRMWAYHFGKGIVETTNDFGRMGAKPTHPELLDWLACSFRDGRQSLKDLHRLIVQSATYQQASTHQAEFAAIDSENRFLWRMNRRRLEAEAIRDSVLSLSGKLRTEMGGPSFRPFRFEDDHSPRYLYEEFDPDDSASHRRSIYRMIVRSVPDPWMASLDCADPSLSVDRRNETLTALQSLSLLNNVFMVRMSEHLAQRASERGGPSNDEQLRALYRFVLQREPSGQELEILVPIVEKHGLANASRLLLNSNEFVFVD